MTDLKGQKIWIIGASSGIGAAVARELAQHGAKLLLSARREDRLAALAAETGGQDILALDIANADAVRATVDHMSTAGGLPDIVINFAALYKPMSFDSLDTQQTADIIKVNLAGSFYLAAALVPHFRRRGHGQIVLCGSVAGFCGLPNGQPYSATKAGIINLGESLRAELHGTGIVVQVINPGFVRTDLTAQNDFDMPAMIEPAQAAQYIVQGLQKKSFEIHFPRRFTLWVKFLRLLPYALYFRCMRFLQKG
jgi:short-subunit dehydrogenase